jgi:hypothetical protein
VWYRMNYNAIREKPTRTLTAEMCPAPITTMHTLGVLSLWPVATLTVPALLMVPALNIWLCPGCHSATIMSCAWMNQRHMQHILILPTHWYGFCIVSTLQHVLHRTT